MTAAGPMPRYSVRIAPAPIPDFARSLLHPGNFLGLALRVPVQNQVVMIDGNSLAFDVEPL